MMVPIAIVCYSDNKLVFLNNGSHLTMPCPCYIIALFCPYYVSYVGVNHCSNKTQVTWLEQSKYPPCFLHYSL